MAFNPEKLRKSVLKHLRPSKQDGLHFKKEGLEFLQATVEIAARIKDERHAQAAMNELVRILVGLETSAPKAGEQLREIFKNSPAALKRLVTLKGAATRRFNGFTGTKVERQAPKFGAQTTGQKLRDFLPVGDSRMMRRR